MDKKYLALCLIVVLFTLVGCKKTTVTNNRYEQSNAPTIIVNPQYEYIGDYEVLYPVLVGGNRKAVKFIRADVFVKAEGKRLVELCLIETKIAGSMYGAVGWKELNSETVTFKGEQYVYDEFMVTSEVNSYIRQYFDILRDKGYEVDGLKAAVGAMTRKMSHSLMVTISYAVALDDVEISDTRSFLMEKLSTNFELIY